MFKVPEKYRMRISPRDEYYTSASDGNNGAFKLVYKNKNGKKIKIFVIASDGMNWEHVSVSITDKKRCPNWSEMCFIKSMFWSSEDVVIQYHPAESEYVSFHDYCLHMWRPINQDFPAPNHLMVAPKI